jgi:hypothetical protein
VSITTTWDADLTLRADPVATTWDTYVGQIQRWSTWDAMLEQRFDSDMTWDALIRYQIAATWDAFISEKGGAFRGLMTETERDALEAPQALDTVIVTDTFHQGEIHIYTGTEWVPAGAAGLQESKQKRPHIFPTFGEWRVEAGDPDFPLRYWDGVQTYFSVDDQGNLSLAGDLSLTGGGLISTGDPTTGVAVEIGDQTYPLRAYTDGSPTVSQQYENAYTGGSADVVAALTNVPTLGNLHVVVVLWDTAWVTGTPDVTDNASTVGSLIHHGTISQGTLRIGVWSRIVVTTNKNVRLKNLQRHIVGYYELDFVGVVPEIDLFEWTTVASGTSVSKTATAPVSSKWVQEFAVIGSATTDAITVAAATPTWTDEYDASQTAVSATGHLKVLRRLPADADEVMAVSATVPAASALIGAVLSFQGSDTRFYVKATGGVGAETLFVQPPLYDAGNPSYDDPERIGVRVVPRVGNGDVSQPGVALWRTPHTLNMNPTVTLDMAGGMTLRAAGDEAYPVIVLDAANILGVGTGLMLGDGTASPQNRLLYDTGQGMDNFTFETGILRPTTIGFADAVTDGLFTRDIGPSGSTFPSLWFRDVNGSNHSLREDGIYALTSTQTISNSNTETAFATFTLPGRSMWAGSTIRFTAWGDVDYVNPSGTFTWRFRGTSTSGTTILTLQMPSQAAANTNQEWYLDAMLTFQADYGTSVAFSCGGICKVQGVTAPITNHNNNNLNINVDRDILFDGVMATANAGNIFRTYGYVAELVKRR